MTDTTESVVLQDDAGSQLRPMAASWLNKTIDDVVANGWTALPIRPGTKTPGELKRFRRRDSSIVGPARNEQGWVGMTGWNRVETTPERIEEWKSWPEAGVGIRCDGVVGIDIDVDDADEAAAVEGLVVEVLGPTPLRRVGRAPRPLLVYRQAQAMRKSVAAKQRGELTGKVEYIAGGGQFVAFAVHPDTHRPYTWGDATPTNTRVDELPAVTKSQLDELSRRLAERWGCEPTQVQLDTLRTAHRNALPFAAPPTGDPVFVELVRRGMVKSVRPNDEGWYVTLCPQAHLHTNGDPNAGYWPGRPGAHHCFHAHCEGFGRGRLKQWFIDNPTSDGVVPDLRDPPRPIVLPSNDFEALRRARGRAAEDGGDDEVEAEAESAAVKAPRPLIMLLPGRRRDVIYASLGYLNNMTVRPLWTPAGAVYVNGSREVEVKRVVEVQHDGEVKREVQKVKVKTLGTTPVSVGWLRTELSEVIDYQANPPASASLARRQAGPYSIDPPPDIAEGILKSDRLQNVLPELKGIIATPTMRPDGTLLTEPGFDSATGFYLFTDMVVEVAAEPTRDDALAALEVLRELIGEVRFADAAPGKVTVSEAVALSAMIGIVLRPAFEAQPAVVIDAPAAGSGKSYLMKILGVLATGREPAVNTWPHRGEELNKMIDAMLYDGVSQLFFDNANSVTVTGNKLCTSVSEPLVSIRILGETRTAMASTLSTLVCVNGNRVRLGEDMAQRSLTMRLDPRTPRPRDLAYARDPIAMLKRDRAKYVAACLTIGRAFVLHHQPSDILPPWAGFDGWTRRVRSALAWLGLPDPQVTLIEAVEDDSEGQAVNLIVTLADQYFPSGAVFKLRNYVAKLFTREGSAPAAGPGMGRMTPVMTGEEKAAAEAHTEQGEAVLEAIDFTGVVDQSAIARKLGTFIRDKVQGRWVALSGGGDARIVKESRSASNEQAHGVRWKVVRA